MTDLWINFSICYEKMFLHSLLKFSIKPFVKAVREENISSNFLLSLGSYQGDHLKISLEVSSGNILKLERLIKVHVIDFLQSLPPSFATHKFPLDSVFIDFPINTLHYNVFKKNIIENSQSKQKNIQFGISDALLDALGNEVVDDEIIFSFTTYMQLIFLGENLSRSNYNVEIQNLYNRYSINISVGDKISINKNVSLLVANNLNDFIQVLREILGENISVASTWIKSYKRNCRKNFSYVDSFEKKFLLFHTLLMHDHLNIKDPKRFLSSIVLMQHLSKLLFS